MNKNYNCYKTIGEVAKILSINLKIENLFQHTQLDFGKNNLNK